jgi:predicted short-subunit dehydrogenase-like oxidoreductase (DUF2520 family)
MSARLAFIGAGRLCSTLARAAALQGYPVVALASRNPARAAALAERVAGAQALDAQQAVDRADLVFVTVPDDAIAQTAAALTWHAGQRVVHCSGATEVTALEPARRAGALPGGFHPMQNVADPDRALDLLAGSSVAIEAPAPLHAELVDLASRLGLHPLTLPPGARALYHGGASFAASFLTSLLDEAVSVWQAFGATPEQALRALLPVARGTLEAAATRGLAGAVSGPISRGDAGVVARHVQALQGLGGEHAGFYRQMSLRQLELVLRADRLSPEAVQRLRDALGALQGS